MADNKPTTNYYQNLGGVNLKASKYEMSTAQFLNLRNFDFDTPNALSKRPGSTQAITAGTSGPISSIFEFSKLNGASYVIVGSDTAMFYIAGGGLTLLSAGWNNGQPTDMLTFVDKLWMANGQHFEWWSGGAVTSLPAGLPVQLLPIFYGGGTNTAFGLSAFAVAGATHSTIAASMSPRAVYVAASYTRSDGFMGPVDFLANARNLVIGEPGSGGLGDEYFGTPLATHHIGGFTIPSGYGISAISIWLAVDTITPDSPLETIPGVGNVRTGLMGWQTARADGNTNFVYMSYTLKPDADLSRFWLFTTIAGSSLFLTRSPGINGGVTYWAGAYNFYLGLSLTTSATFGSFNSTPNSSQAFSGTAFAWFNTYIPKYIEVNQNIMFTAGFSSAPSLVWFSNIGDPETIEPENKFEVRTNDGDRIFATKTYQDNMIIMKEKSFHKIIGDNADNFQLVAVSNDYGCISNKTVIEYKQKLLWLDRKGILEFTGANYAIISDPVEPIFRRMNLTAAKEKACAVHHIYRNQVWFGIPIDGATQNNITVVYDYLIGGWTFFDGFNPDSFAMVQANQTKPTAWRGDYSGFVHYFNESLYGDNGVGITCLGFTRFENEGGENQTTLWRRFFLDLASVSGLTGTINMQTFSNYDQSTVQATFAMYQNQFQSRAEFGVVGKALAIQFSHFSASLPLLINGYGLAKRGLRNV